MTRRSRELKDISEVEMEQHIDTKQVEQASTGKKHDRIL